jgi:hypothetical protein
MSVSLGYMKRREMPGKSGLKWDIQKGYEKKRIF